MKYVPWTRIDCPSVGVVYDAKKHKATAWTAIKQLRWLISIEPLGGNRHHLRLELLKAESAHMDAMRLESGAMRVIERWANELGLTTIKPKKEKQCEQTALLSPPLPSA